MIYGIPTDKGLEVLNSQFKTSAQTFALVGAPSPVQEDLDRLVGRDPDTGQEAYTSDLEYSAIENHIYHRGAVDVAYYDENKALTFEINLGNLNTDQYLFGCLILGDNNAVLAVIPLPKLILSAEVGGVLTIKFAIKGRNPGELIFLNRDFPSYAEWEVFKKTFSADFLEKMAELERNKNSILSDFDSKIAALQAMKEKFERDLEGYKNDLSVQIARSRQEVLDTVTPASIQTQVRESIENKVFQVLDTRINNLFTPKQAKLEQALQEYKTNLETYKRDTSTKVDEAITDMRNNTSGLSARVDSSIAQMNNSVQDAINRMSTAGVRISTRSINLYWKGRFDTDKWINTRRPQRVRSGENGSGGRVYFSHNLTKLSIICFNFKRDWYWVRIWPALSSRDYGDDRALIFTMEAAGSDRPMFFSVPLTRDFVKSDGIYCEFEYYDTPNCVYVIDID
ncbi:hypothetical protein NHP20013_06040 [Helicobacter bizzozeronii]|nr:hypothetical protein NHP20013_06040 [Helicobacter bizzozeronii]